MTYLYYITFNSNQFKIDDEAIYHIIEHFTREAGVRELNRYLGSLIRKAIKEILVTKVESVHVTKENINTYLGRDKFTDNAIHDNDTIGVVTGLAYTQFGGDTLDVEATYYRGKGGLVLTGKLGDVMKELLDKIKIYSRLNKLRRIHRVSYKGECLINYLQDIVDGKDVYNHTYEQSLNVLMENGKDRKEAAYIQLSIMKLMRGY